MFANKYLLVKRSSEAIAMHRGSTYATSWKIFDLGEVLGESEAGEEGGGHDEELHGGGGCLW